MNIKLLEKLSQTMVGDGKTPNVFFVSIKGAIHLITTDFNVAYDYWRNLARNQRNDQPALEDRRWGTICDFGLNDTCHLVMCDDSHSFRKQFPKWNRA